MGSPLVYQGFTKTKEKHILHQPEQLNEEYWKIKSKKSRAEQENQLLK